MNTFAFKFVLSSKSRFTHHFSQVYNFTTELKFHTQLNNIDWEGVKVLDKETNWFRRGVKEAINIKRTNSDLNRDRGRHYLPRSYNRIILSQSRDADPTEPGHVTPPASQ